MKRGLSFYLICLFFLLSINTYSQQLSYPSIDTNWNQLPVVLARIHAPVFPNRDINIVNLGAPTNGTTIATTYIQKAIDSCSSLGGGRVIIPSGTFLTGAITLKSNVNLHISAGATLKFSTTTSNYLPVVLTRFEGIECYNYSPFIYSNGAQNIAITGSGTLNGQASNLNWWAWKTSIQATKDDTLLNQEGQNGTPVNQRIFGSGHQLRPVFIQFYNSQNILIDSITIINSPMWEVNPVLSQNIIISNLNINSHGPNNDGCDPECCKDVLIYNCSFSTGDDCIAIKSGRNNDGRRVNVPSQYVVIQNCTMADGHGAIALGSECSGGISNVFAENCNMSSPNLGTVLRFKTNSLRGGIIENIFMRNCTVGQIATGDILDVDMYYQEGDVSTFTPVIRNIEIDSVTCSKSASVWNIDAYQRSPLSDIKIIDCNFNSAASTGTLSNVNRLQIYNSFINNKIPLIPTAANGFTEAESYNSKFSWGWSNVMTGYNGNGYTEFVDKSNYIDYNLTRSQDEIDTINFRYANADTFNKPCILSVNGVNAGELIFSPSGNGWKNETKNIGLKNGNNIVRLVSLGSKPGVYLDQFTTAVSSFSTKNSDTLSVCPGDNIYMTAGKQGNYTWQVKNDSGYIDITGSDSMYFTTGTFYGTATDTFLLANASSDWYGKQFRCMIINGLDTTYSKIYTLKFVTSWTGAVDTAWENPANWKCGSIPDTNTDVIINTGSPYLPKVNRSTSCRSISIIFPGTLDIQQDININLTGKPSN